MNQADKAELLLSLHHRPEILLLPNAWDCASARIFEETGFPAIATTSAGIAFTYGYPDGQFIPRADMLAAVKRIAACVRIPVTADLEGGYEDIEKTATGLIESGAVGLNIEDTEGAAPGTLVDVETQTHKIGTVRRVGNYHGIRLVINARTDLYLAALGDESTRFERALERLRAYRDAGADCLFIPGVTDETLIRRFVEALQFPINILASAGSPPVPRMAALGVTRLSVGSGLARAAMGATHRAALQWKQDGRYEAMTSGAVSFADANALFRRASIEAEGKS